MISYNSWHDLFINIYYESCKKYELNDYYKKRFIRLDLKNI